MFSAHKFGSRSALRHLLSAAFLVVTIALVGVPAFAQKYDVHITTSDIAAAGDFTDTNLVNPWGLVASAGGPWWVSDNGTGLSTLYDGTGSPKSLVVTIPSASGSGTGNPTGIVFNSTSDFKIGGNTAVFLFATEDGTISGWSSGTSAVIAVNNAGSAVYKGLALASAGGKNYLYAANFFNASVDVFDGTFAPHSFGSNAFKDSNVPMGYAPFNVANIGGGKLVVTYAKQNDAHHDDVKGPGNGYVDIYDTQGNLLQRLPHLLFLNAPWAVAVAPSSGFGAFSGDLLIGQFGSGAIVGFDPTNGNFIGLLLDPSLLNLRIDGLWGLGFGNGSGSGKTTTLYFTAGNFGEAHGLFGTITAASGQGIATGP